MSSNYLGKDTKKALANVIDDIKISLFEKQLIEYEVPWKSKRWMTVLKRNWATEHKYQGWNRVFLWNHTDDTFLTKTQIAKLGATIKNDNPITIIGYFPMKKFPNETEENFIKRTKWRKGYFKAFKIYGVSDVNNLPEKKLEEEVDNKRNETAEDFIKRLRDEKELKIEEGGNSAWFDSETNTVRVPKLSHFNKGSDIYYLTLFKEISLWASMKESLVKTEDIHKEYSVPALIAEITSAALCHAFNMDVSNDSADYVKAWLETMKKDVTILPIATKKAEKLLEVLQ